MTSDIIKYMQTREQIKAGLKELLKTDGLTERERVIIEMRYGLKDGIIKTLEEVGKTFNVTRERIRQIEAKAIEKMGGLDKVLTKV